MTELNNYTTELTQITIEQIQELFKETGSYFKVRKQYPILNYQKLINLLRLGSSFLLDSRSRSDLFTDRVGANWYQFTINGHDSEGNKKQVSFYDCFQNFVTDVFSDLAKCLDSTGFEVLVQLLNSFIQHPGMDIQHKFAVINAENSVLKDVYEFYIWDLPEIEIDQFIEIRKDFTFECISTSKNNQQAASAEIELESLYSAYEYYLFWLIKSHIRTNRFKDIMQSLDSELEKCNDAVLGTNIIWNMITCNNQFLIRSKLAIEQKVADFRHLIQENKNSLIMNALKFSPADIDLRDFTVELGSYELSNIDFRKTKTHILATVPLGTQIPYSCLTLDENTKIEFRRITNPLDDPIYSFLNDLGLNINGMPLAFLSDALQNVDNATLMVVTLNDFYHPDFEILNSRIAYTDFTETEALWGRKYYPHKEKMISLLRALLESRPSEFPFEIPMGDININLISNYLVSYIDESGRSFFHKVYTITNPNSFPKIVSRHLEKVSKLNLSEEFISVRDIILESHIGSSSSLCDFVLKAMEICVKKSIELRGGYKYLWEDASMSKPLTEPSVQPLIKSHIQPFLELKGIQISREVTAANGSLDYLCSYTKEDKLFKVGIELKNAHHPNLLNGLSNQLPAYLDDEGTQDGIFMVLWYKNQNYPSPARYNTIDELMSYLQNNSPENYRIQVIVIDCTKKVAPSKR